MVRRASVAARDEGGIYEAMCVMLILAAYLADSVGVVVIYLLFRRGLSMSLFGNKCRNYERPQFLMVWCDFNALLTNPSKTLHLKVQHKLSREVKSRQWIILGYK